MKKRYAIISGLGGGYNSEMYREVGYYNSEDEAIERSREIAIEEAELYGIGDEYYEDEDDEYQDYSDSDLRELIDEEIESWLGYQVVEVPEEMEFDEISGETADDIRLRIKKGKMKYE